MPQIDTRKGYVMTPRVERLLTRARRRRGSFWLRRRYVLESYAETGAQPVVIRQALALDNILRRMPITVVPGELIVGYHPESPAPPDAPGSPSLYPKSCRIFTDEERGAISAGVFTSSVKTGHLTPNFPRLLSEGYDGILQNIEKPRLNAMPEQQAEREAMAIAVRAASHFSQRYARRAGRMAQRESDPLRARELETISEACHHVAHHPARNLHEALQLLWFGFLIECIEEGEGTAAFALGRFDQYCWPYWRADLERGVPREDLYELIGCFWVKLNEFSGLQVLNLTIGGTDRDGDDAVNDVSYACLELMSELRTATPSLSVRYHPKIDKTFFRRAMKLSTEGIGQPAFYGDASAIKAMVNAGVDPKDAVQVVPGGCVELGVQGCCYPWVGNFFNMPKCLDLALHNGRDPGIGGQIGPKTGEAAEFGTFEKLLNAYRTQVGAMMDLMAHAENSCDDHAGKYCPYPFLSAIVDDCIERGVDIACGGARYNFTEVQGVGIAHVVDSLLNVKRLVYERGEMTLPELVKVLDAGFEGDEPLRRRLQRTRPCYGDNSPESAEMAREVVHGFYDRVERYTNPRAGDFRPGLLVWTLYDHWRDAVGALPDGYLRGDPLVSSIAPREAAGIDSPTSIIRDVTAFDHFRCAGGLTMNLRFDRGIAQTDAPARLIEVYFDRGGMQLQLNVVDSDLLREAQTNPEEHAGLVVRVSGFSARFVEMSRVIQEEIIARSELKV